MLNTINHRTVPPYRDQATVTTVTVAFYFTVTRKDTTVTTVTTHRVDYNPTATSRRRAVQPNRDWELPTIRANRFMVLNAHRPHRDYLRGLEELHETIRVLVSGWGIDKYLGRLSVDKYHRLKANREVALAAITAEIERVKATVTLAKTSR